MVSKTNYIKLSIGSFDLVKGTAIILIVLGHMMSHYDLAGILPDNAFLPVLGIFLRIISAGINPMFFIVKGYTSKEAPVKKTFRKSFSGCVIPYLYAAIAIAILFPIVNSIQYGFRADAFRQAARWVLAFLFGLHDPYAEQKVLFGIEVRACWVTWFLLAMFLSVNLFNLILKVRKTAGQIALVILSVVTGCLLGMVNFTYFCLPQGLIAVGYCYTGYSLKRLRFFQKKRRLQIGICGLLLIPTIWEAIYGSFDLAYNIYRYGPLEIACTCCSGLLLMILCLYANEWKWSGLDWIRQIGVYTLWIMCIHSVELICLPWDRIVKSMPQFPLLAFVLEIILKVLIFTISCTVLKKNSRSRYRRRREKSKNLTVRKEENT